MKQHFSSVIVALIGLCGLCSAAASDVTNLNVVRFVDLTAPGIVREKVSAIFKPASAASVAEYTLAVPIHAGNVSYIAAVERRNRKSSDAPVPLTLTKSVVESGLQYYIAKLSSPITLEEKSSIDLTVVYTHVIKPYPKVVGQLDPQYLIFPTNAYFSTPYFTEKQKTTIKLRTSTMKGDVKGPKPVTRSGTTITYGPYNNIEGGAAGLAGGEVTLHYEDPTSILVAKTFKKEVEISHLGSNVAIMESYDLHNRGAELRGSAFSRIDFQQSSHHHSATNVLKGLQITLPSEITNLFFRDDIGNVSTSNFRRGAAEKPSILQIRPRYPVYGGWKYSWFHHFDAPLRYFLKVDSRNPERHVFSIPFIGSISNITIEEATIIVALPEGAKNIKLATPFAPDSEATDTFFTNLDTIGRPRITITKRNVADEYAVPVQISYDYPQYLLLVKPLVVSAVFLGLFVIAMILVRVDLRISPEQKDLAGKKKQ